MTGSLSQSYRKTDRCSPFIKPSLRGREGNSFIILIIISSICELYRILGFIVTFFIHAYSVTGSNGHFLCSLLDPLFSPHPCPDPLPCKENSHCKVRWRKSHTLFGANRGGPKREPCKLPKHCPLGNTLSRPKPSFLGPNSTTNYRCLLPSHLGEREMKNLLIKVSEPSHCLLASGEFNLTSPAVRYL